MSPAMLGGIVWLGAVAVVQPDWAAALLLAAPLVAAPLALASWRIADRTRWLFFTGAVLLIPAYACEAGAIAAACTLPWLLLCAGFALEELCHWPQRREPAVALMRAYLAVGAGWLLLARLGARPLGFEDVIVHATAVHFHYAGFILPALLLRLTRADGSPLTRWALGGVLAGVPLVAAGITLTVWQIYWLESGATLFLATACWLAAWQQGRFALCVRRKLEQGLLLVSSAALGAAMVFACLYALGRLTGTPWLDISFMVRFHGSLQVFGFALPALAAWRLVDVRERDSLPASTPLAILGQRVS